MKRGPNNSARISQGKRPDPFRLKCAEEKFKIDANLGDRTGSDATRDAPSEIRGPNGP